MEISRRQLHRAALGLGGLALAACAPRAAQTGAPNTLVAAQSNEPVNLNTAITSAAPATFVATKIFDGLIRFAIDGAPQPQLAERWEVSPDGKTFTFQLRQGVTWHDGKPFTADDVAYSLNVWKTFHGRGRTTFANVTAVESPSPLVSIWRLSEPAPYLLSCLAASESTVLPRHLYEGTDPLTNPFNLKPVGTGPFRFETWRRGSEIVLARNPAYWKTGLPGVERLVVRFLPDSASTAVALETGAVDVAGGVAFAEAERLRGAPSLQVTTERFAYSPNWTQFEFNLDRPELQDVRVRQAFAHAIDRGFIAKSILGAAEPADSPVPRQLTAFHAEGLPAYPFDLARANALLDAAGLKRGANGERLKLNFDFNGVANNVRIAAHIRSTLAQAGVTLQLRPQDHGEYVNRVYSRRDFDTCMTGSGAGLDPAIGVQRYYWSKNFKRGVAFSNGAHYANPEVDRLLEAAQVELDPAKRKALYADFQRIAMTDLPYIPLAWTYAVVVANKRVRNLLTGLSGLNGDFAEVTLA